MTSETFANNSIKIIEKIIKDLGLVGLFWDTMQVEKMIQTPLLEMSKFFEYNGEMQYDRFFGLLRLLMSIMNGKITLFNMITFSNIDIDSWENQIIKIDKGLVK